MHPQVRRRGWMLHQGNAYSEMDDFLRQLSPLEREIAFFKFSSNEREREEELEN